MTLRDLERIVYRRLNKNVAVPQAETQERIRGFLNERQRMLLAKFPSLRQDEMTFASVADQQRYALPEQGVARIDRIWETTNDRTLTRKPKSWIRTVDPDPASNTGTPDVWAPLSYTQVHTQPSDASEVFVDSTSASDTGRCFVEGIVTGGYRRTAEVTMTGTTAVSVNTAITTWIQIDKFYLADEAVGVVTLHEDASGGTELSRIEIGDTYARFLSFLLWPTPSAAITYSVDITRGIADMVNPTDEPLLPEDFHDLLAVGARLDEYEKSDDPNRRRIAEVEWDEGVRRIIAWLVTHPDTHIDLNTEVLTPPDNRRSSLGPFYPAGS